MKKIIKLTEQDLEKIVKKVLSEQKSFRAPTTPDDFKPKDESNLKKEKIKQIQFALKYQYKYDIGNGGPRKDGVDGVFGERTEKAVKDFQIKNGLQPTGIVGGKTEPLLLFGPRPTTNKNIVGKETKKSKYNCIAISSEECGKISKDRDTIISSGSEKACARYMNKCLAEYDKDISGNAWTVLRNLKARGIATEKYNAFKEMNWGQLWGDISKNINSSVCQCHKQDHADKICTNKVNSKIPEIVTNSYPQSPKISISDLKLGDIVGMYYNPSTNKGQAFCSRLQFDKNGNPIKTEPFEFNSHVGFVVAIKDGVPIILHNIGNEKEGLHHATPATKLLNRNGTMIVWVASDNEIMKNLEPSEPVKGYKEFNQYLVK